MSAPVRFRNLILVGSKAAELAAAAEIFAKTVAGQGVGNMGAAAAQHVKSLLSPTSQR